MIYSPAVSDVISHHINCLTHWGWVMHICVSKLPTIGSDNGLSLGWRQAIIWINAGILLIGPLWTNFSEILIEIQTSSFKKVCLKESSAKWRQSCFSLNVLTLIPVWPLFLHSLECQIIFWNRCWLMINAISPVSFTWRPFHRKCSRYQPLNCVWIIHI